MKTLLTTLKSTLQAGISYVRDMDVYISPHTDFIPGTAKQPCIGLKDGDIRRIEKMAGCIELRMEVNVCLFSEILKDEAGIIGDPATGAKGVLGMAADVDTLLDENFLGIAGMQWAFCTYDRASRLFRTERALLVQKVMTYTYEKEILR